MIDFPGAWRSGARIRPLFVNFEVDSELSAFSVAPTAMRNGARAGLVRLQASWPSWDAEQLVEDQTEVVIQVNGRVRSKIQVPRDADEATVVAAALADEKTQRHLVGKSVRKRIYVPNRLVNLVVG